LSSQNSLSAVLSFDNISSDIFNRMLPINLVATAGQTVFTMPAVGRPIIFVGGVIQREGVDYNISGSTLTMTSALGDGDTVIGFVFV
jgi:hypothetical protein